ncbi:MAG: PQQ-binding-like beta-propeller repeat protein [Fimbriimonadales bacterium]
MSVRSWLWAIGMALGIASAQMPYERWRVIYNDGEISLAPNLWLQIADGDGGSYHAGYFEILPGFRDIAVVLRLDAQGNLEWLHRVPYPSYRLRRDPAGNLQVFTRGGIFHYTPQGALLRLERLDLGSFSGNPSFAIDSDGMRYLWYGEGSVGGASLVKRSPSGEVVWSRILSGVTAYDVYVDAVGMVIVAGEVPLQASTYRYPYLAKLDGEGNLLWQWQSPHPSISGAYILGETPSGEIVLRVGTSGLWFSADGRLLRRTEWQMPSGCSFVGDRSALLHADGRIAFSFLCGAWGGLTYFFGVQMNASTGELLWQRPNLAQVDSSNWGWLANNAPLAATPTSDATWFFTVENRSGAPELKLFKLNAQGQELWVRTIPFSPNQGGRDVGLIVNANGESLGIFSENEFLRVVRYDTEGNLLGDLAHPITLPTTDSVSASLDGSGGVYTLFATYRNQTMRLRRYDNRGALLWEQPITNAAGAFVPMQLAVSASGEALLVYGTGNYCYTLRRYRADGTLRWQRSCTELLARASQYQILPAHDDTFYFVATMPQNNRSTLYLLKLAADGSLQWLQSYPNADAQVMGAVVAPDNSVCLSLRDAQQGINYLIRFTAQGELAWEIERSPSIHQLLLIDNTGLLYVVERDSSQPSPLRRIEAYSLAGALLWRRVEAGFFGTAAANPTGGLYLIETISGVRRLRAYNAEGALLWEQTLPNQRRYRLYTDMAGRLYYFTVDEISSDTPIVHVYCHAPSGALEWMADFMIPNSLSIGLIEMIVSSEGRGYTLYGRAWTPAGDWDAFVAQYAIRARGDADNDGCVDDADLLTVLFNFGTSDPQADLNGDGSVDEADLLEVVFNFGTGC